MAAIRICASLVFGVALALTVACGGDSKDNGVLSGNAQAVAMATATPQATTTPEVRSSQTPSSTPTPPALVPAPSTPVPPPPPPAALVATATPSVTSSSSSGGAIAGVPYPFDVAAQGRASLLGHARTGGAMDPLDNSDPLDLRAYPGWQRIYPSLRLVGSAVNATSMAVSVYRGALNSKEAASAANPKVIAFAVGDSKGGCAGAVIQGFPIYSRFDEVNIGPGSCNAQSALAALPR